MLWALCLGRMLRRCCSCCTCRFWDQVCEVCRSFAPSVTTQAHVKHWRGGGGGEDGWRCWGRCEMVIRQKLFQSCTSGLEGCGLCVRWVNRFLGRLSPVTRCRSPASACGSSCERACSGTGPRCTGSQPATWDRGPPRHRTWTSRSRG